jgi:hypothetical protein
VLVPKDGKWIVLLCWQKISGGPCTKSVGRQERLSCRSGLLRRALFIGALVAVTIRGSSPQSESFASVYETPGDLIRLALGLAVCLWIAIHLFMLPRTAEGYRTWLYLGLVAAPLALAAAIAIW